MLTETSDRREVSPILKISNFSNSGSLPEDVFDLVKDRGVAVGRLVVNSDRVAELFHQFALLARQFRGRHHQDVVVQIAFAAAPRIGKSLALDAKDRAALRAFRNFQFFFPVQSRHLQFRAKRRLRNAHGDSAIQIRAAPLEERMFLDFQHHVQIAGRPAIWPGLSFAGDAQPRSGVHPRRNPQLDGLFAFQPSLPAALLAALFHNLARALACRARARDGEESLLVSQLSAAGARLASLNSRALFSAGAVAGFAEFLPRQLDLGGYAGGSFLKRERHVVA